MIPIADHTACSSTMGCKLFTDPRPRWSITFSKELYKRDGFVVWTCSVLQSDVMWTTQCLLRCQLVAVCRGRWRYLLVGASSCYTGNTTVLWWNIPPELKPWTNDYWIRFCFSRPIWSVCEHGRKRNWHYMIQFALFVIFLCVFLMR